MHTCTWCSHNGLSVDRIWSTISLSYYIQKESLILHILEYGKLRF